MESTKPIRCAICANLGLKQCQACQKIFYCSIEHQKEDWKRHRAECSPFILRSNDELGRHFVAARKIRAGSIILDEYPLIFGPRWSSIGQTSKNYEYCLSCCKPLLDKRNICQKCTWPLFCSISCTKTQAHAENECRLFVKKKVKYRPIVLPSPALYRGIIILRALLTKPTRSNSNQSESSVWKLITNLQYERSDKSTNGSQLDNQLINQFRSYFKLKNLLDNENEWTQVSGAIDVNAFSLERVENEGEEASEVTALFDKASLFAHSCIPNCTWGIGYSPKFSMRIRTSQAIEKGEILTVSYNPNWGYFGNLKRMKMIGDTGGFRCNCRRCADPTELNTFMSSLTCPLPNCTGNFVPPVNSSTEKFPIWTCSNNPCQCIVCPETELLQLTENVEQEWNEIISNFKFLPVSVSVQLMGKFISSHSGTMLHRHHWLIQQASRTLVRTVGNHIKELSAHHLIDFITQCRYLLEIANILNPGISLERALMQLYLSRALFLQYKSMLHQNHGDTSQKIVQILDEIRYFQQESFLYWRNDIQSKSLQEPIGFEAQQLNGEIIMVLSEYEHLINNTNAATINC